MQKRRNPSKLPIATIQFHNDFPDPKIIFLPGSSPSSSRHRKRRNLSKTQQSLVSNFRKIIFPTQKIIFFSGTLPNSSRHRKRRNPSKSQQPPLSLPGNLASSNIDTAKKIPANPSNRHSPISQNDFPNPKITFFQAVCQSQQFPAAATLQLLKMISPTQKSFFPGQCAKQQKTQQKKIQAKPSNRHSNLTTVIFPTQRQKI